MFRSRHYTVISKVTKKSTIKRQDIIHKRSVPYIRCNEHKYTGIKDLRDFPVCFGTIDRNTGCG